MTRNQAKSDLFTLKESAQKVSKEIGLSHRRWLHIFMFNAKESGDKDFDTLRKGLKKKGYDYDQYPWDKEAPLAPPDYKEEEPLELWYEEVKQKILNYLAQK